MLQGIQYYWNKFIKKARRSAIKGSSIHPTSKIESGSQIINTTMDRHSFCGYDCQIVNCSIGSFCSISNNVIIGGGMHPMDWVGMSPVFYEGRDSVTAKFSEHKRPPTKPVTIGHDVWIGQSVLISQGVTIGTGAVIGMGAIVTKNVEPYSIVAGSPAKEIRKRFDDQLINQLLKSQWWNFNDKKLKHYAKYFQNPIEFIDQLSS